MVRSVFTDLVAAVEIIGKEYARLNPLMVSGACGAVASVCVGQPLDTLKVKMQTFPSLNSSLSLCFRQTIQSEGFARGLYAGVFPALAANVTENSILFASYGACQKLVASLSHTPHVNLLSPAANGMSGFLAGFW